MSTRSADRTECNSHRIILQAHHNHGSIYTGKVSTAEKKKQDKTPQALLSGTNKTACDRKG